LPFDVGAGEESASGILSRIADTEPSEWFDLPLEVRNMLLYISDWGISGSWRSVAAAAALRTSPWRAGNQPPLT
jgi:hypothetical protein